MNIRAEKAFIFLPKVIDQINMGIIYNFDYGTNISIDDVSESLDPTFKAFKIDLTYLINHYVKLKLFTTKQVETLNMQIASPDKDDWLLAFVIIDNQKHILWTSNTN